MLRHLKLFRLFTCNTSVNSKSNYGYLKESEQQQLRIYSQLNVVENMAVGRLLLACAISLLVLRLLMLFGLLKVNLNHASEVSPYLWRFCKTNDSARPCSTRIIIRRRRDFTKPIGLAAGLLLLCGDIATQPGPGSSPGHKNIPYCSTLKCLYLNSRSIGKKLNGLQHYRLETT